MTHYDAILNHIKADTPCTFNHVKGWAVSQGFGGSQFIKAIEQMINNGEIMVIDEGHHMVVELVSATI